jgi:hypothetical protein
MRQLLLRVAPSPAGAPLHLVTQKDDTVTQDVGPSSMM